MADIALADWVFAPHYALGRALGVGKTSTMVHDAPNAGATAVSQLLLGEDFHVLDTAAGWAWGYCDHDHYVGYVRQDALAASVTPTHVISVRDALLFERDDIKSPAVMPLNLGARLQGEMEGEFLKTASGFVHGRHVAPIGHSLGDAVTIAAQLIGAPYLWGGRGAGGIDCSGLVQIALALAGIACPRDSDQQREVVGSELAADEPLTRGDLVFFPGHVGIMVDADTLLHANAWWMAVTSEPLQTVVDRLAPRYEQPVLARRRPIQ